MSYTSADLAALDAAIKNAELEVDFDGQRVRYRSIDELLKARRHVADLLASSSAGPAPRRTVFSFKFLTSRGE